MSIRKIDTNESLVSVWEDLVYTEARLLANHLAKTLASFITKLIARVEEVQTGQRLVWRGEIGAQAHVDAADDELDDVVADFDAALEHADKPKKNKRSPRQERYFRHAPHTVIRLGLESELGVVREWPESMKSEPEKEIKELGGKLEGVIVAGDAALKGRGVAEGKRADHRVREILRLIDDANAARLSIYGKLIGMVEPNKLPADWPNRFFRRSHRMAPAVGHGGGGGAGGPDKGPTK